MIVVDEKTKKELEKECLEAAGVFSSSDLLC